MNPIQFECPYCREINTGDESMYGERVKCTRCGETLLVPPKPAEVEPPTARLIPRSSTGLPSPSPAAAPLEEAEIFDLYPVARAYLGHILLGAIFLGLALALEVYPRNFAWTPQAALGLSVLGVLVFLLVWIKVKSHRYRLTTQRLFVRRGWLAQHVDELELYRVKDVTVDQGLLARLLGYGTITVLANDDTTPQVELVSISSPMKTKETIRTHYRAARQNEKVRPTEFMRSP